MTSMDLDPVDRITAGAVGPPGQRTFYLQARKGDDVATLMVEKQQVQLLSASILEILARVGKETGEGPEESAMELEEPVEPMWRAGRLSIGYLEDRDLLLLEIHELVPEEEDTEDDEGEDEDDGLPGAPAEAIQEAVVEEAVAERLEAIEELEDLETPDAIEAMEAMEAMQAMGEPEGERVRMFATREQMLSLSRHGAMVASRGRPTCQFCGNPIDPEGHVCPAMNGHGKIDRSDR
jgi:uncharacterized repeat protein (TIGR03847 family)